MVDFDSRVLRESQFRHLFRRYELRRDDYDDVRGYGRGRDDGRVRGDGVHVLLALRYIARNRSRLGGIRDNYIHSRTYNRRRLFRSSIRRNNRQSVLMRGTHEGHA